MVQIAFLLHLSKDTPNHSLDLPLLGRGFNSSSIFAGGIMKWVAESIIIKIVFGYTFGFQYLGKGKKVLFQGTFILGMMFQVNA